ncbi:MAG: glycosyltransferase [Planctomycetes bacterium]|nr:glycosyltransferase [Planctomycetota bacterium]
MERPHLLLGGWYKPGTGFTRVLLAVVPYLRQHFRITWLGIGYQGEPFDLCEGVRVLPTNLRGGDQVGAYYARLNWHELAPDVVFALNDIWYLVHYSRELGELLGSIPMVGYLPLDGGIDDPRLAMEVNWFHELVTYTNWAAAQLTSALREMGIPTPVSVAGHGVDLRQFQMLPRGLEVSERADRARQLFGLDRPAFVVLNASRPDPRKRLDVTLAAFARFAAGKPDNVRLCLHQAHAFDQFVVPLREQADRLGIMDRLLWFPPRPGPLDDAGLNELYNACAVGLNTTYGEGFGLVSFEHAATGAPQVLPAHPALCELWQQHAALVRPVKPVHTPYSPLLFGEVDAADVADALERLYSDPLHYQHLAQASVARCAMPDLQWSVPAERLVETLLRACRPNGSTDGP